MNRLFLLLFGMVSLVAHAQVPDYVPTEGLVAWYPFNGNANDESGNGNDGEVTGAISHEDRFGNSSSALAFDGNEDDVRMSSPQLDTVFSGFNAVTMSIWVFGSPESVDGEHRNLMGKGFSPDDFSDENPKAYMLFKENENEFSFIVYSQPFDWIRLQVNVSDIIQLGVWNQLTFRYDGGGTPSSLDVYRNGEPVPSCCSSINYGTYTGMNFNSEPLIVGSRIDESGNHFKEWAGVLDDIGIWNRALSEEEIFALYNAELPIPGCTDSTACNFNSEATSDDGSCIPSGCMEVEACNYNALAECEGEACDYTCCPGPGCCLEGTVWDAELGGCIPLDTSCPHDLDFDGVVGVGDLMDLLSVFGTDCPTNFTCGDPVSYHGYDYATVQIGEQCWFAENLRTELYQNGDSIPGDLSTSEWSNADDTNLGAQAVYGEGSIYCENEPCDEEVNLVDFGRLYNWFAVDDARGLCPNGWHVPSDGEYTELTDHFGGEAVAGDQMKTDYGWFYDGNGPNSSGFSALPGGWRTYNGSFGDVGYSTSFWSSTPNLNQAWNRELSSYDANIYRSSVSARNGYSVRCLKD